MRGKNNHLDTTNLNYVEWIWNTYLKSDFNKISEKIKIENIGNPPNYIDNLIHMQILDKLNNIYKEGIETDRGIKFIPGPTIKWLEFYVAREYYPQSSLLKSLISFYKISPQNINKKVINRLRKLYLDENQKQQLNPDDIKFMEANILPLTDDDLQEFMSENPEYSGPLLTDDDLMDD